MSPHRAGIRENFPPSKITRYTVIDFVNNFCCIIKICMDYSSKYSLEYSPLMINGVGNCSALGAATLSGHNFYGESYIPME